MKKLKMSDLLDLVEIKAKCSNPSFIRKKLIELNADFKGIDFQIDTYFKCNYGRLKLREGNLENNLIQYIREKNGESNFSKIILHKVDKNSSLKQILIDSLGILTIVRKKREIYFVDNVKIHIDEVDNLGSFVEVEVINERIVENKLEVLNNMKIKYEFFITIFGISKSDFIYDSYSDLIQKINK